MIERLTRKLLPLTTDAADGKSKDAQPRQFTCMTCFEDLSIAEVLKLLYSLSCAHCASHEQGACMRCEHFLCLTCWRGYVASKIDDVSSSHFQRTVQLRVDPG